MTKTAFDPTRPIKLLTGEPAQFEERGGQTMSLGEYAAQRFTLALKKMPQEGS